LAATYSRITKKMYGLTNGHVAAMDLEGKMSAMPVVVTEREPVVIVQNSDEDYTLQTKGRAENLARLVAFDRLYGGANPGWGERRTKA